jgi:DNA repair protein RadC
MAERTQAGHRQRLRDRFTRGEEGSRSEETLLELLLTCAIPQKDVQSLAKKLLSDFGGLSAVLEAPMGTLSTIDGIKGTVPS